MTASPRYPSRFPWFTLMGLLLSLAAGFWFVSLWQKQVDSVQSADIAAYVRTAVPSIPFWKYSLAMNGRNLAGAGEDLTWISSQKENKNHLREWLREYVYDDKPLWRVLQWPLAGWLVTLLGLVFVGGKLDEAINSEARNGRVLRGPRLVSKWRWNCGIKPGFWIETR